MRVTKIVHILIPAIAFIPPVLNGINHPAAFFDNVLQDIETIGIADADVPDFTLVLELQEHSPCLQGLRQCAQRRVKYVRIEIVRMQVAKR